MRGYFLFLAGLLAAGAAAAATPAADALWQQGDYRGAFAQAIEPAIRGNAHAQFLIGEAYRLGRSVDPNFAFAELWYSRAARQGDLAAATELGLLYASQHQAAEALPWLNIAARHGEPRALCTLAALYYNGDGVARDEAIAFALMTRAAAAGLPEAQLRLATLRNRISPETQARAATIAAAPFAGLAQPPAMPAAPEQHVADRGPPVRIQVGAFRSAEAAERAWDLLADRVAGIADAEHAVVRVGAVYRLQARVAGNDAARDFSRRLKAARWQHFTREGGRANGAAFT